MKRKFIWFAIIAGGISFFGGPNRACADAPAWMHAAANASLPAYDEKTAAVLLYSENVTTVMADGRLKGLERRVYKILRPEGRRYATAYAHISNDQRVGSMRGWCIPKQGKDYEVRDKDAVEQSALAQWELASDSKVRILKIPAGDPGNVVGYEIEYQARPYVLEDQWGFQENVPVKEARYTLQMPSGWEYKAAWLNHNKIEPNDLGGNQWQWIVRDVAEIRHEPSMPPFEGLAGRMVVAFLAPGARQSNGFLTWDQMAKWQTSLANGKRETTPDISNKVAEITAGKNTPQLKMEAIAQFIQKDIRYVAVEIGVGGWQPHAAGDIFTHRYGDCKDKVTLMSTMLKLTGIDSYYLFINTERGAIGPQTPPMRMFDHAILAIKLPEEVKGPQYQAVLNNPKVGRLLIFDPTDEKTPIGGLYGALQGSFAFLVEPDGGELIETPQLPTRSNGVMRTGKIDLDAQGTLRADIKETRNGDFAAYERYVQRAVRSSKDQVKRIEQEVAYSIGMFQITSATMTALDTTNVPFGYSYTFIAPAYAKHAGDLLILRPRVMGLKSSDLLETKEPRKFPVIFEGPQKDTDNFEIALPAGYEVDDLPPAVDVDYSFGSYHSKTEVSGRVLKYTRSFEIKELSVPLDKMDDLKKFYRIIGSDERNTAVLKPSAQSALR